jgi:hypothetical protein
VKITLPHYERLRDAIAPLAPRFSSHRSFLRLEGRCKDLEKRLRWDAFAACGYAGILKDLYAYLTDDHIDTALRSIMREIEGGSL